MNPIKHLRRNAVAYVALFASLGTGSAYAAHQITGKDIARNAITSKHVKNGSLQAVDFARGVLASGAQGPRGPQGPQGDTGPKGDKGDPGSSVFDGSLPSGKTMTGHFAAELPLASGKQAAFGVSFPVPAPLLANSDVNFAPGGTAIDGNPDCTGSFDRPTAPPGDVCLYEGGEVGVSAVQASSGDRYGFTFAITSSGADPDHVGVVGTWAYTAP
jgi:hypothetical protein